MRFPAKVQEAVPLGLAIMFRFGGGSGLAGITAPRLCFLALFFGTVSSRVLMFTLAA